MILFCFLVAFAGVNRTVINQKAFDEMGRPAIEPPGSNSAVDKGIFFFLFVAHLKYLGALVIVQWFHD